MITYTRSQLARKLSINPETLRYYEKIKIMTAPRRHENGYRVYSENDFLKLQFVLKAKEYGFTLKEIVGFLSLLESNNSGAIRLNVIIKNKIAKIDEQIESLQQTRELLFQFIDNFNDSSCAIKKNFLKRPNIKK